MKTIFVQVNNDVPEAVSAGLQLQAFCADQGIAWGNDARAADLIVALGGDGTLLRTVHATQAFEAPYLSVRFGRLGFLSGAEPANLIEAVSAALEGKAPIESHTMLKVRTFSAAGELACNFAINELVLRTAGSHMLTTRVIINGHTFCEVSGDGLIVATATGSTAYALSAGGPVLAPSFEGAEIVALAPHTLVDRAVVTSRTDRIRIELPDPTRAAAALLFDGKPLETFRVRVTALEASIADEALNLVKFSTHTTYEMVAREFFRLNQAGVAAE